MSSDDGSSDSGLLNANETPYKSVKDSLPPVWVDKLEKAEEDLTKIQIKSALPLLYFSFLFLFCSGGVVTFRQFNTSSADSLSPHSAHKHPPPHTHLKQ
jgi:hypothetical protein